ncbi:MAG: hypothetical protein WBN75_05090 [Verrucomicrobiia bacterium]
MNDATPSQSGAMPCTPAKDVSAMPGLDICHSDIPASFGFRHSSFRTSSVPLENIKDAEMTSQLFTRTEFNPI